MSNVSLSLREVSTHCDYHSTELDLSGISTFGRHDNTKFAQVIRNFGDSPLHSISPGECDYAFNCLLRDRTLYQTHPDTWKVFAQYLCDAIAHLISDLEPTSCGYRTEYARFMTEWEKYRKYNAGTEEYMTIYNGAVVSWRFNSNQ